jgi:tetratricopeptide (TPR) repeat protein
MNKNSLIGAAIGAVIGFLTGNWYGFGEGQKTARELMAAAGGFPQAAQQPGLPPGMPPGMSPPAGPPGALGAPTVDVVAANQRIDMNLRIVAKDPKNLGAWVTLGNDYFDTRQYQRSIDAYGEALRIQPNNPDVLTDQGVMYEQTQQFDKALANFEQAQRIAPTHVQSAYNIGIVWMQHKRDDQKAMAAWRKVVAMAPTSPQAADARRFITELEARGVK